MDYFIESSGRTDCGRPARSLTTCRRTIDRTVGGCTIRVWKMGLQLNITDCRLSIVGNTVKIFYVPRPNGGRVHPGRTGEYRKVDYYPQGASFVVVQ